MSFRTLRRLELFDQIDRAQPGERILYHVGWLPKDRAEGLDCLLVNSTALAAWQALEKGLVRLAAKRLDKYMYEYVVVKRAEPEKVVWMGCYHPDNAKRC